MRSRDRKDTWGWCYHKASSVTANAYMQKARSPEYRYFEMRLQLEQAKGQRLLAVKRVHAGINWQLRRPSDGARA
jgi:hypothetical protein